jgi:hypothetical protein
MAEDTMAFVYVVRCNFTRPDLEAAWNEWYNGPKLKQMLAKPLFLSGQRFAASALETRRKYLAVWTVASPQAFETPEYRSDWGFFEWAPHIADWSRDLYTIPGDDPASRFAVAETGALYLVAFDGLSASAALQARHAVAAERPAVTWLSAVGLDQHSPLLGLYAAPTADWRPAPLARRPDGVSETLFRPISAFTRAVAAR